MYKADVRYCKQCKTCVHPGYSVSTQAFCSQGGDCFELLLFLLLPKFAIREHITFIPMS
jgi:hypothetical protein